MATIVPHRMLQPDTLLALIEEFVTRDGSLQGQDDEIPLADKVEAVRKQLKAGAVVVAYDEATETCTLVTREEAKQGREG